MVRADKGADGRYNAGLDHQEQARLEEAIAEYDEAIKLNPEFAAALKNLGLPTASWDRGAGRFKTIRP